MSILPEVLNNPDGLENPLNPASYYKLSKGEKK